jgi:hypothetical protein
LHAQQRRRFHITSASPNKLDTAPSRPCVLVLLRRSSRRETKIQSVDHRASDPHLQNTVA